MPCSRVAHAQCPSCSRTVPSSLKSWSLPTRQRWGLGDPAGLVEGLSLKMSHLSPPKLPSWGRRAAPPICKEGWMRCHQTEAREEEVGDGSF